MSTGASDAVAFLGSKGSPTLAPDVQAGAEAVARAEGKMQADAEPLEEWRRLDAATTERDRIAELLKPRTRSGIQPRPSTTWPKSG